MFEKLHLRWLLTLLLGVGGLRAAHATHILGGDIAYAPVEATTAGVPRYHVKVRLFKDESSLVDQPDVDLMCNRGDCNAAATDYFRVNIRRTQSKQLTAIGCAQYYTPARTYYTYFYEADVDLPRGQWTLSVTAENRVASIINVANSVNTSFYISAFLDNALVEQNSSPQFLSNLLPYVCGSAAQRYSFSTFDAEGDSLAYSFITPQMALVPPASGRNVCGADVVFLPGQFQLNPATGALTAPTGSVRQGVYAMAARVHEYRRINGRWQPIGYIVRDITYLVYSTTNASPQFTSVTLNNGAAQPPGQVIPVRAGQAVSLTLSAADPEGQALRFSTDATSVVPGLRLTTLSATQARLTWAVPATLPPGRYTATVAVFDNGCPLNASEEQTFVFQLGAPGTALAARPALPPANGSAYPLPFREQVQFQAAAAGQAVTVVDELGRVVAQLSAGPDGRVRWQPTPTLPAGLYVARGADGRPLARLLRAGN